MPELAFERAGFDLNATLGTAIAGVVLGSRPPAGGAVVVGDDSLGVAKPGVGDVPEFVLARSGLEPELIVGAIASMDVVGGNVFDIGSVVRGVSADIGELVCVEVVGGGDDAVAQLYPSPA